MRILLTGADGQLGRELQKQLAGTPFLATSRQDLDITDREMVSKVVIAYRPDCIIHSAAWSRVDEAEAHPDLAWRVNAVGTQNIALACRQVGACLAYISTDYVFDGKKGSPYTEVDQPNPQSVYGKSKYAGETLARQLHHSLYVFRTAWLYGDGANFVRTILNLVKEKKELQVVADQIGCPTHTADLAQAILRMIKTGCFGTYHAVNQGNTSWYEFARKIVSLAGHRNVQIRPILSSQLMRPAPRPGYSALDTSLLHKTLGYSLRPWDEALAEYLAGLKQ